MQLTHTRTTMFLVTNTTRLRAALRRVDPYTAGSLLVILLIIAGGLARNALQPAAEQPIIVIATPALGSGQHSVARRLERAPAAVRALPTAIVPTAAPLPMEAPALAAPAEQQFSVQSAPAPTAGGYIAHTTEGDLFIPNNATPVPAGVPYDGPFLAPEAPTDAPRYCTGFGDSRDFDPMYAASPVCHKPTP